MIKFTKITALAVATLVMASTSAMAISNISTSGGSSILNRGSSLAVPGIAGGTIAVPSPTRSNTTFAPPSVVASPITGAATNGSQANLSGISRTANAFATGTASLANGATTAAGAVTGAQNSLIGTHQSMLSAHGAQMYRFGVRQGAASSASGGGGLLGGLSSVGGLGSLGGINVGTGGLSGSLGSLSGGLTQLGYNLNTIGNLVGVNLGGRTLMQAGGIAGIGAGVTNGQNWTNFGNNLTASANQFGTGITQSVNQIGSAFSRRTPTGTNTTTGAPAVATTTGAPTPAPAPTP